MQKKFFCCNCGAVHYSFNDFHGHRHIGCLEGSGYWVEDGRRPTMRALDGGYAKRISRRPGLRPGDKNPQSARHK